jgi:hypothetical protein
MGHFLQNIVNFFKRTKDELIFEDKKQDSQITNIDYSHLYRPDYSLFYNPDNSFSDDFYSNLVVTINWTEKIVNNIENLSQINFSTILRLTNPNYEGKPFYNYTGVYIDGTYCNLASTPEICFNYLSVLNEALVVRAENTFAINDITQFGRILEFDIDLTTHDGAPCAESEGFVDESDIPPIDTWFYLTKTKLYCWIPNLFIEKMQGAIDVEIFDSYRWIKDSNPSLQLQTIERLKAVYNIDIDNSGVN